MSLLKLASDQSKAVSVEAHRHVRPLVIRIKKAARASLPFFITAAVGVFIPILHFVIVPAAVIAMVVLATREMTTQHSYTIAKLECPHCATPYGETEFARLPKRLTCFQCRIASTLSEEPTT